MISEEHRTKSLQQIEDILNREVEECREKLKKLILPEIEAEHYQCYSVLDSELLGQIILQIASVNALITNYNKVIQSKIADPLSPVECVSSEDLIPLRKNNVQPEMSCVLCIVLIQLMCWLTFPMHGKN